MSVNINEEVQWGYTVSEKQKKLWNVELDLLEKLDQVCKKHNVRYYADWGSLLGAVRHKGFIPWDDDVDVSMFIEDYDKFCEIAPSEFEYPYFFQSWRTQDGFWPFHIRIRRSDTTGATFREADSKPGWNRGIFLDVFPMYNITGNVDRYHQLGKIADRYRRLILYSTDWRRIVVKKIYRNERMVPSKYRSFCGKKVVLPIVYNRLCEKFLDICREGVCSGKSEFVCCTSFKTGKEGYIAKREWYEETINLPFMDTTIPAPKQYDKRLKGLYGDYLVPVKGTQFHTGLIYDTDIPYDMNPELVQPYEKQMRGKAE